MPKNEEKCLKFPVVFQDIKARKNRRMAAKNRQQPQQQQAKVVKEDNGESHKSNGNQIANAKDENGANALELRPLKDAEIVAAVQPKPPPPAISVNESRFVFVNPLSQIARHQKNDICHYSKLLSNVFSR